MLTNYNPSTKESSQYSPPILLLHAAMLKVPLSHQSALSTTLGSSGSCHTHLVHTSGAMPSVATRANATVTNHSRSSFISLRRRTWLISLNGDLETTSHFLTSTTNYSPARYPSLCITPIPSQPLHFTSLHITSPQAQIMTGSSFYQFISFHFIIPFSVSLLPLPIPHQTPQSSLSHRRSPPPPPPSPPSIE